VQHVLDYFEDAPLPSSLLCFLDDEDTPDIKSQYGVANRALYGPIHDTTPLAIFPSYVTDCILVDDGVSIPFPRAFDNLIYVHGNTCEDDLGLTMALAHELQHAIQHATARKVWAVNGLIPNLSRTTVQNLQLTWKDIPIEREARIVSKRVGVHYFGEKRVQDFIDRRIAARVTESDVADWQFVRGLDPSSSVDVVAETAQLLARLKDYRSELESVLNEKKMAGDPDFIAIDLTSYFEG